MESATTLEALDTAIINNVIIEVQKPVASSSSPMVHGLHKNLIKVCIWINIFFCAIWVIKNPIKIFSGMKRLKGLRDQSREGHTIVKYTKAGGKYYYSMNTPGWPSQAFSKFITNNLKRAKNDPLHKTLDTLLFGITKKCGYQCEHCFEWDILNKPETLSRNDIVSIIQSFQQLGITQVQLSGGEPLNRIDDIKFLLPRLKRKTEFWLYTSGYHFSEERAKALKDAGLTGVIVSLDHWKPEVHNNFRGVKNAFEWAQKAVANARDQNIVACLSLCATKEFISDYNLSKYAELAKNWGISFIQILEPRAVGHYAGLDVLLDNSQIDTLEKFYINYNYNKVFKEYPSVIYHGFYSRRIGCGGAGKHFVYVDTDGDVQNCTFCRQKLFSALRDPIEPNLKIMMSGGCGAYSASSKNILK